MALIFYEKIMKINKHMLKYLKEKITYNREYYKRRKETGILRPRHKYSWEVFSIIEKEYIKKTHRSIVVLFNI